MSVNSFNDYPISWASDKQELTYPTYYRLADIMERDIKGEKLSANTKLPPQRELADFLDLNLSIIAKVYKLCEMRGLIHAVTGRGTFVTPYANMPTSTVEKSTAPRIGMALIHPSYESSAAIRDLTVEILKEPFSRQLFGYSHPLGDRGQILAGARWLSRFRLDAGEHSIAVAAGVQNALATMLPSLFEVGDRIAVDTYTYPNFVSLANQLYLQLVPIENDREGMRPDQLESACTLQNIEGVYMMSVGSSPTNIAWSDVRKTEIGGIIRKMDPMGVKDDNYASLLETPHIPVILEAPGNCIYVSGLSKPLCPGLRIAYLYVLESYANPMEQGIFSQNLKISSLNMGIAAEIIRSDLACKIIRKKQRSALRRNGVYVSYFPDRPACTESYYQWLELPIHCTGRLCEAELVRLGVSVFGAERFSAGNQVKVDTVRVTTCSAKGDGGLKQGLTIPRGRIRDQEEASPSFVV